MKFKLVQFTILLVFVISILIIAHTPSGFGHDPSEHPPEFYVDYWTGSYVGTSQTHMYAVDPRSFSDYSGISGNDTESASSWSMRYYPSGLINGDHKFDDDSEMVYAATVSLSASAGNSSCSGSVSPSLTQDMGLYPGHAGWSGTGTVDLEIQGKDNAHYMTKNYFGVMPDYYCSEVDVPISEYATGALDVRIEVSDSEITKSSKTEITTETTYGGAKLSATWTGSVSRSSKGIYSYPAGIDVSLTVDFWYRLGQVDKQLTKTANVTGNLGAGISPTSIKAEFDGQDCEHY